MKTKQQLRDELAQALCDKHKGAATFVGQSLRFLTKEDYYTDADVLIDHLTLVMDEMAAVIAKAIHNPDNESGQHWDDCWQYRFKQAQAVIAAIKKEAGI